MNKSNEVSYAAKTKNGSAVSHSLLTVGFRQVAGILFVHRRKVGEGLEPFFTKSVSGGLLLETDPRKEDGIHDGWYFDHYWHIANWSFHVPVMVW
jgi:hypothetical protein